MLGAVSALLLGKVQDDNHLPTMAKLSLHGGVIKLLPNHRDCNPFSGSQRRDWLPSPYQCIFNTRKLFLLLVFFASTSLPWILWVKNLKSISLTFTVEEDDNKSHGKDYRSGIMHSQFGNTQCRNLLA
jgi:hypothetical protein